MDPQYAATLRFASFLLDTTISPGQSFTVRWETGVRCATGWEALSTHWATTDTDVVRLDTLSGLVTARATGDAVVIATKDRT